jgi:hypothetical protein
VWDVVVVGGGVAGLAAAGALARDRRVLLLEARDRFGGRVDTRHEPDWPLPIEAGAEFIHGRPPVLERLCRRAGVRRIEDPERHFTGPSLRPATHAWKQAMELIGHLPKSGPDRSYDALAREPWWRRLGNRNVQVLARQFVEGFNAAPAADISAVALGQQTAAAEEIEGDRLFRPDPRQGGYRRVVDRMIDDVIRNGGQLRLSSPALRISWRRGSVAITTSEGVERARRAVITLPAGVLQASPRLFSPSLPPDKRRALRAVRMGPVLRILLRFRRLPSVITSESSPSSTSRAPPCPRSGARRTTPPSSSAGRPAPPTTGCRRATTPACAPPSPAWRAASGSPRWRSTATASSTGIGTHSPAGGALHVPHARPHRSLPAALGRPARRGHALLRRRGHHTRGRLPAPSNRRAIETGLRARPRSRP